MAVDSNLAGGEFGPLAESGIPRDGDFASAFIKLQAAGDATANDISALGESSDVVAPTVGAATPTDGVDEVQTITTLAASGTFRLRYEEKVSADIDFDVDAAGLQVILRALHGDLAAVVCGGIAGALTVTFEGAAVAGRDVGLLVVDTDATDTEDVAVAETTAGALGSVSIAYTEDGGGDSVLATVVNDTTGEKFDVQVDAGTPAVFDGLPVGDYTGVFRTVTAAGRVSPPDTVTFSIASA